MIVGRALSACGIKMLRIHTSFWNHIWSLRMAAIRPEAWHQWTFGQRCATIQIVCGPQIFVVADLITQITATIHLRWFQYVWFLFDKNENKQNLIEWIIWVNTVIDRTFNRYLISNAIDIHCVYVSHLIMFGFFAWAAAFGATVRRIGRLWRQNLAIILARVFARLALPSLRALRRQRVGRCFALAFGW